MLAHHLQHDLGELPGGEFIRHGDAQRAGRRLERRGGIFGDFAQALEQGPASRSSASPASVRRRRRVLRSNSRAPSLPSSRDTDVLTDDLGRPSRSAARVKLPSVATVQKVSQSFQSVVRMVEQ